ncbi:GFA family protein [Silicimonas algicola]|uniref:GFA family protein n=1 Tax=Silicimonas algicola TaxID=1826607 RepID=UPI003B96A9DF
MPGTGGCMTLAPSRSSGLEGGCLCGRCRFTIYRIDEIVECHCLRCRRLSGGAPVTWVCMSRDGISWTRAPSIWLSSTIADRGFCPTCGCMLWMAYRFNSEVAVPLGSLDERGDLASERRIHAQEAE